MARLLGMTCLVLSFMIFFAPAGAGEDTRKTKQIDFEKFFKMLDENMDGKLNREEFLKMADRAKDKAKARDNLNKTYDKLDPDKKGISKERFKEFMDSKKKRDEKIVQPG